MTAHDPPRVTVEAIEAVAPCPTPHPPVVAGAVLVGYNDGTWCISVTEGMADEDQLALLAAFSWREADPTRPDWLPDDTPLRRKVERARHTYEEAWTAAMELLHAAIEQ